MPFCRNCGSPVDGQFCTKCGTPAQSPAGAAYTPPPPQPPPAPQPPPYQPPPSQAYAQPAPFTPAYAPPPMMAPGVEYAPWVTRVAGFLIDYLLVLLAGGALLLVAILVFGSLASIGSGLGSEGLGRFGGGGCCCALLLMPLASLLVGIWNKAYLVSQRGSSIGQGVMKIKVVDAQGQFLTMGQAVLRLLAHVGLSLVPLGGLIDLLWPLWDERRQTLHDKAVGCYVITNPAG